MTAAGRPGDGPLFVLPHTGLRVPHTELTVTGYRGTATPGGTAYIATLCRTGQRVGTAVRAGYGGATRLHGTDVRVFSARGLRAYAAAARTPDGHAVGPPELLDTLVIEALTDDLLAAAARRGLASLRQVRYVSAGGATYTPDRYIHVPGAPEHLPLHSEPDTGRWWQAWTGRTWHDLTRRPER